MSMLPDKIIVLEAAKLSGALYTAYCGVKYEKQVYSVPGKINSKCSEGTNMLINEGIKPYLSINTIIKEDNSSHMRKMELITEIHPIEEEILNLITKKGMSVDKIKMMLNSKDCNLEEVLFDMEVKGQVKQVGGLFIR